MKARVFVTLKPGVLDPQGKAIHHALEGLGFGGVQDVLVLNQTNLDVMIKAKGANASKWIASTVTLTTIPSKYNGQPVQSVYISKVI